LVRRAGHDAAFIKSVSRGAGLVRGILRKDAEDQ
jgi:hypothetical protein